jgi:plasmid stabilization system protein ParE
MGRSQVIWSRNAQDDLALIATYIARTASVEIADKVVQRLYGAMYLAAHFPLLYPQHRELLGNPRKVTVLSLAMYYEILPRKQGIRVLRILHSRRDLRRVWRL